MHWPPTGLTAMYRAWTIPSAACGAGGRQSATDMPGCSTDRRPCTSHSTTSPARAAAIGISRWRNGPAGEIAEWVVVPETDGVTNRSRELARSSIIGGTTMEHYAGIDVSVESASVCVMDAMGRIVRDGKVASEPAS